MGYLEHEIEQIEAFLLNKKKTYNAVLENSPAGTLQVLQAKAGGALRYFHCVPDNGRYLRTAITANDTMIRMLADKEYARHGLAVAENDLKILMQMKNRLTEPNPETIKNMMKPAYRTLPDQYIRELSISDERRRLQQQWAESPFEQSDYKPEKRNKKTSRGLYVRSKSELLIAEKFYQYDVPFRYEQLLQIGLHTLAPDFTFLDSSRREFYLEYCGMMDDPDYVERVVRNRRWYERIGISAWTNMIYIYEKNNEIDLDRIDRIIRIEILPRL